MSSDAIASFLESPYGYVADVKMLNFFRHMSGTVAWVMGGIVVASIFLQNFWCRYLCPYGALMGLAALLSPLRIRRVPSSCIDCARCAKACPSHLPVDQLVQIRSAECLGCLECVAACPAEGALHLAFLAPHRKVPPWAMAAVIGFVFLSVVLSAKATGHWNSPIADHIYRVLIPQVREFAHP
jgi:Fe-S-cluster-containing hydrogenase component 2